MKNGSSTINRRRGNASATTNKPNIHEKMSSGILIVAQIELNTTVEHNWWDWAKHVRQNASTTTSHTIQLFSCDIAPAW